MTANTMTAADLRKQAEELQAQAQRIEQEAKEAERKAKEEEHRIRREAEEAKKTAERKSVFEAIASAVAAETETREAFKFKAATVKVNDSATQIIVNGTPYWNVELKKEYSATYRWQSSSNGKMRISVGDYGNKTSFPQRKDGTFSWMKIAEAIVNELVRDMKWQETRSVTDQNNDIAKELAKELGYDTKTFWSYPFEGSAHKELPIMMKLSLGSAVSVDKAKRIVALWKQINAVMNEK